MDMKNRRRKQDADKSESTQPQRNRVRTRFEWPLLVFPVLFLATLVALYLVNRSIENSAPTDPIRKRAVSDGPHAATQSTPSEGNETRIDEARERLEERRPRVGGRDRMVEATVLHADETTAAGERSDAMARSIVPGDRTSASEPTGQITTILREAARRKDHATIKRCLDELVAMGDDAVVPLTELISENDDEAGLWAAEALARIGTPAATRSLLDALSQVKEGQYKVELGKRVANISNHESWPLLLDTVQDTADATVLRAAATALSRMADPPIVDEIVARYEAATTEEEAKRLAQIISSISSPKATESLLSLAGDVASAPQDDLQRAAVAALARIGDPQSVSFLLRRLEASPPGQGGEVFNAITQIDNPEAQASLLYAAAGNKEVSAEHGRTAAIYALQNFPNEQTCVLLEQIIAVEDNAKVATAAMRTLDNIRRLSPHVVANADSVIKEDKLLPVIPKK